MKSTTGRGRPRRIRVAVQSHTSLDQGALEALVGALPGLEVVGAEATPPPDVLLWDPAPGSQGSFPPHDEATAVLVLVDAAYKVHVPSAAAGLFARDEAPASLGVAVRQVARGQEYLSPSLALALLRQRQETPDEEEVDLEALTQREREVLALLAEGLSNKEIAARLYLSVRTVEGHLTNAYGKLDVHSRTEAALLAARHL